MEDNDTPSREALQKAFSIISAPLSTENTTLKERLRSLTTDVATLKAENTQLTADLTTLKDENTKLQSKVSLSDPNNTANIVQKLIDGFKVSSVS